MLDHNYITDPMEFCYLKGCGRSLISLSYVGNPVNDEESEKVVLQKIRSVQVLNNQIIMPIMRTQFKANYLK